MTSFAVDLCMSNPTWKSNSSYTPKLSVNTLDSVKNSLNFDPSIFIYILWWITCILILWKITKLSSTISLMFYRKYKYPPYLSWPPEWALGNIPRYDRAHNRWRNRSFSLTSLIIRSVSRHWPLMKHFRVFQLENWVGSCRVPYIALKTQIALTFYQVFNFDFA